MIPYADRPQKNGTGYNNSNTDSRKMQVFPMYFSKEKTGCGGIGSPIEKNLRECEKNRQKLLTKQKLYDIIIHVLKSGTLFPV